ncbi:MAG: hypothetical protein U0401_08900 [Anaerolineae bacterium]
MTLNPKQQVYLTIEWQEHGPLDASGRRLWRRERKVYTIENYPQRLPCHNPDCEDGGFEIGEKIAELLASGENETQNSLICLKAIHQAGQKRCLHVITYAIACVRPFQRRWPQLERVI